MKLTVLKDVIMYILIVFLSIILIQFYIERMKMEEIDEVKIGQFSICQSGYTLHLFHPIEIDKKIPLFYEITFQDSIISKKKFLETITSPSIDSFDFNISCSDSAFYLIYLKENDTLIEVKYSDFISEK